MPTNDIKAILTLSKMTADNQLKWKISSSRNITEKESVSGRIYETKFDNRIFVIYRFNSSYYHPEHDEYFPTQYHKLEVFDEYGNLIWEFPKSSEVGDLYNIVRKRVENIDELLNNIIISGKDDTDDSLI